MNKKMKVYIIAEAGVNHNGNFELAIQLIDIAKNAGVDAIKFQTAVPELVMTSNAKKAQYQEKLTGKNETQLEMAKKIHLPLEDYKKLNNYCYEKKIQFLSTPFDYKSIECLENLDMPIYKIPSGEITHLPYLRQIAKKQKPIIMSTGMATIDEIKDAITILLSNGLTKNQISLLHCTTEYPCPFNEVNLNAIKTIKETFNVPVGYSDHTEGISISLAAVAMGATIIEKHFTLDKTLPGPDHKASLAPNELKELVQGIRQIEKAMGNGIKKPSKAERKNINVARKSIVAKENIQKGEIFSEKNLICKRPGDGLSAIKWDSIIGLKSTRTYEKDNIIKEPINDKH